MTRVWAVLGACAAMVGCGGSAGTGGKDPATLAPADAVTYAEATVRPTGDVRAAALDAAGKILDTPDAGPRLRELLDQALDGEANFARDFEPWLGERVGVWATGLEGAEEQYAVIFQVKDTDEAEAAIKRGIGNPDPNVRVGLVDDMVVIAEKPGYARVEQIAEKGEDASLAKLERYRKAIEPLPEKRLGHFYFDTNKLVKAAFEVTNSSEAALLQGFLPKNLPAGAGALIADSDRVAIDTVTGKSGAKFLEKLRGDGRPSPLLKDLPADAWLAFGLPDLGSTVRETISALAGGFGFAGLALSLKNETGLDLEEDVLDWIGDVAVYARGSSKATLDGALVIEVVDQEKAAGAFGKFAAIAGSQGVQAKPIAVPGAESAFSFALGAPQPGVLARSGDRVVIAYGAEAAADALQPKATLGATPLFVQASAALDGLEPAALVDMTKVLALVDAEAGSDPDWAKGKPYLDGFSVGTFGTESGDDGRSRFALGLR